MQNLFFWCADVKQWSGVLHTIFACWLAAFYVVLLRVDLMCFAEWNIKTCKQNLGRNRPVSCWNSVPQSKAVVLLRTVPQIVLVYTFINVQWMIWVHTQFLYIEKLENECFAAYLMSILIFQPFRCLQRVRSTLWMIPQVCHWRAKSSVWKESEWWVYSNVLPGERLQYSPCKLTKSLASCSKQRCLFLEPGLVDSSVGGQDSTPPALVTAALGPRRTSHQDITETVMARQEMVNYLGFSNMHQTAVYRILVQEAQAAR